MEGIDGTIKVMMDRPWTSQGGKKIGEAKLTADMAQAGPGQDLIIIYALTNS